MPGPRPAGLTPPQTAQPLEPTTSLNTNEELERLLDRADQLVAAGRSDLAPVLWQRVLDEAGDVLASQAGVGNQTRLHVYRAYGPLRDVVMQRMVAGGAAALRDYRLQMDGVARLRLAAQDVPRETALMDVVQRLLLTTPGPDAAFELACVKLEQGDFLSAVRLLTAIERCPDHKVPQAAITLRMCAALARLGAGAVARERLSQDTSVSPEHRALLEADLARLSARTVDNSRQVAVRDPLWSSGGTLAPAWHETLSYTLKAPATRPAQGPMRTAVMVVNGRRVAVRISPNGQLVREFNSELAAGIALQREDIVRRWTDTKWQPVGQALCIDDRILVKSEERLLCLDLTTGRTLWMGRQNTYPHSPQTLLNWQWQLAGAQIEQTDGVRRPKTLTEATLFGDQIPQVLAVDDDLVFNLEGALSYLAAKPATTQTPQPAAANPFGIEMPEMETVRRTWLAAYHLPTGKLRWHRPAADQQSAIQADFVSAPLIVGELLVVAVSEGQRLSLLACDRGTGATRWRSSLCDVPPSGLSPWSPVGLAADGGDIFVSSGLGAVFFVDPFDGSVRQTVAYPRKVPSSVAASDPRLVENDPGMLTASSAGCDNNRVLPIGNQLLVLATDFDHVFSLDRRTGSLRWEAPLRPQPRDDEAGLHCLGVSGRTLILGGTKSVRGYDVRGGRIVWETPLATSYGRGAVTDNAVYVPEDHLLLVLDPESGQRLAAFPIAPEGGAPVGNVFVDGDRVVIVGPGEVSMWQPLPAASPEGTKP